MKHANDEKIAMIAKCPPLHDSRWFVAFVIGLLTLAPVKRVKNQRKINVQQPFFNPSNDNSFLGPAFIFLNKHLDIWALSPLRPLSPLLAFVNVALLPFPKLVQLKETILQYSSIFFETSKRQPGAVFINTIFCTCHGSLTSSGVFVVREPPSEAFSESESGYAWKIGLGIQLTNLPVFLLW